MFGVRVNKNVWGQSENSASKRILPEGQEETFTYDANGNLAAQVDFNGQQTSHLYDSLNRLVQSDYADGRTEQVQYDNAGNRTQVVVTNPDLSSEITAYAYDAVGNRTSVSYPNGTSEVYVYDSLNRLTRKETFDGVGALVQRYDYTLHATGRRTQIDELDARSTAYVYDTLYRLNSELITGHRFRHAVATHLLESCRQI